MLIQTSVRILLPSDLSDAKNRAILFITVAGNAIITKNKQDDEKKSAGIERTLRLVHNLSLFVHIMEDGTEGNTRVVAICTYDGDVAESEDKYMASPDFWADMDGFDMLKLVAMDKYMIVDSLEC